MPDEFSDHYKIGDCVSCRTGQLYTAVRPYLYTKQVTLSYTRILSYPVLDCKVKKETSFLITAKCQKCTMYLHINLF